MTTGDSRSAALRTPYPPHTPPRSILPQDRDTTQVSPNGRDQLEMGRNIDLPNEDQYGDPSMYQIAPNYPFQASPQVSCNGMIRFSKLMITPGPASRRTL